MFCYLRRAVIIFVCIILLIAIVLAARAYLNGKTKGQIKEDLKEVGAGKNAEIMRFDKINHSIVAMIKDGDTIQCAIYDKLPFVSLYNRVSMMAINEGNNPVVLTNGWDIYILGISENDLAVENVQRWKGTWTERLIGFFISVLSAIIVIVIIACVKRRKNENSEGKQDCKRKNHVTISKR